MEARDRVGDRDWVRDRVRDCQRLRPSLRLRLQQTQSQNHSMMNATSNIQKMKQTYQEALQTQSGGSADIEIEPSKHMGTTPRTDPLRL